MCGKVTMDLISFIIVASLTQNYCLDAPKSVAVLFVVALAMSCVNKSMRDIETIYV
jgi:hypothetical protein